MLVGCSSIILAYIPGNYFKKVDLSGVSGHSLVKLLLLIVFAIDRHQTEKKAKANNSKCKYMPLMTAVSLCTAYLVFIVQGLIVLVWMTLVILGPLSHNSRSHDWPKVT